VVSIDDRSSYMDFSKNPLLDLDPLQLKMADSRHFKMFFLAITQQPIARFQ